MATAFRWYMNLKYVPFKWLTDERFLSDGLATCFNAMDWEVTREDMDAIRTQLEQMEFAGGESNHGGVTR